MQVAPFYNMKWPYKLSAISSVICSSDFRYRSKSHLAREPHQVQPLPLNTSLHQLGQLGHRVGICYILPCLSSRLRFLVRQRMYVPVLPWRIYVLSTKLNVLHFWWSVGVSVPVALSLMVENSPFLCNFCTIWQSFLFGNHSYFFFVVQYSGWSRETRLPINRSDASSTCEREFYVWGEA